jgi:TRAP transporter TAXI family solute receptor
MVAVSTAGSVENLALLDRGEADFAIVQALVSYDAWSGVRSFSQVGPRRNFRATTALWQNTEQFVLLSEHVKTGTIDDLIALKGATVGLGKHDSGTLLSNRVLLAHFGIDIDQHYRLAYLGYGPAADALQAGEVVAIGIPAGVPTKSLTRAKAALGAGITILSFTATQTAQADNGLGLWAPYTIAAGTYPGQADDVRTIAQPNLLVVNANVDEDAVYRIVKLIFERREFLRAMHSATEAITLESALTGLPVPLHEGAKRFFEEMALPIPQHLIDQ